LEQTQPAEEKRKGFFKGPQLGPGEGCAKVWEKEKPVKRFAQKEKGSRWVTPRKKSLQGKVICFPSRRGFSRREEPPVWGREGAFEKKEGFSNLPGPQFGVV